MAQTNASSAELTVPTVLAVGTTVNYMDYIDCVRCGNCQAINVLNVNPKTTWYVVFLGLQIGVFRDIDHVYSITKGVPNSSFKRFSTESAAVDAFAQATKAKKVSLAKQT